MYVPLDAGLAVMRYVSASAVDGFDGVYIVVLRVCGVHVWDKREHTKFDTAHCETCLHTNSDVLVNSKPRCVFLYMRVSMKMNVRAYACVCVHASACA